MRGDGFSEIIEKVRSVFVAIGISDCQQFPDVSIVEASFTLAGWEFVEIGSKGGLVLGMYQIGNLTGCYMRDGLISHEVSYFANEEAEELYREVWRYLSSLPVYLNR